jgi:hypothetical protein
MKIQKKHLLLSLLLPIQIILVQVAGEYPAFIELYYSNGVYPIISRFLRLLFGWVPFSVGDLMIAILSFTFFRFIYRLIKSRFKNWIPKAFHLTAILSGIYFCFYLFWGLNYYRAPLGETLAYNQKEYSTNQLISTTNYVVEQLNFYQHLITHNDSLKVENPYSQEEMYLMAIAGYQNLEADFPMLTYKTPSIKSSLMSLLQTYNGTSGYFNPLTGEAQVNDRIPKTGYPTTTCHEMAHQIGFAAENEANFVGFLAAKYNDDVYFKYASYRMAFAYLIGEVRKRDRQAFTEIWKKAHKGIRKDFKNSATFWQSYKNPFEPLVKKGYNAYLKANKQDNGTASYSYVVDLLISYFKTQDNSFS